MLERDELVDKHLGAQQGTNPLRVFHLHAHDQRHWPETVAANGLCGGGSGGGGCDSDGSGSGGGGCDNEGCGGGSDSCDSESCDSGGCSLEPLCDLLFLK